jgi:Trypsin-co-occurring domain 1
VEQESTQIVPVTLTDGTIIRIEARDLGGATKVGAFDSQSFKDLTKSIEAIAATFRESLERIEPRKASIEFGIEVGLESGQLTALICKGSGKANIKVALEWSPTSDKDG